MARTDALGGRRRVGDVAADGVAEGGERLPFLDVIQASFGAEHDLSGVEAHIGGAAAEAAAEIGADAYATGNHVAFQDAPDLFTAAHEAAHVVQQQAGVQLLGGVGEDGDTYEQHADAVAERVVRGESAADLLAGHGGGSGSGNAAPAVQRSSVRAAAISKMKAIKAELDAKGHIEKGNPTVASTDGTGLYTKYCGYDQETLMDNWYGAERYAQYTAIPEAQRTEKQKRFITRWESGDISHSPTLTGCNGFTGKFASELELGNDLGVFKLAENHAGTFVHAKVGRYPKEGDIVKLKQIKLANGNERLHVCVSYNAPQAEGDAWEVLEGGQGGPDRPNKAGADKFHFTSKPYATGDVEGWIDIEQHADEPARKELAGSWEVELNGETWLYTFPTSGNEVRYEGISQPDFHGTGTWDLAGSNVVFTWPGGTPESWKLADVKNGGNGNGLKKWKNANAMLGFLSNKKFEVTLGADTWIYRFSAPNRVRWENAKNPTEGGGGTWLSLSGSRHVSIRWDGGTEEHWPAVTTDMKNFAGTPTAPGGKPRDCTVHPTW